MKPLQLIGTQRTQYTHRKNRESKKIKPEMQACKDKSKVKIEKIEKEDAEFEDEDDELVSLILIKLPNMTASGFGTRF